MRETRCTSPQFEQGLWQRQQPLRVLVMTMTLSNIPVRLAVDHARVTSALSRAYILQQGISSNVDHNHHLATLTIQTPEMSLSCPLTFEVVDGLQCDIAVATDWFDRTTVDISDINVTSPCEVNGHVMYNTFAGYNMSTPDSGNARRIQLVFLAQKRARLAST